MDSNGYHIVDVNDVNKIGGPQINFYDTPVIKFHHAAETQLLSFNDQEIWHTSYSCAEVRPVQNNLLLLVVGGNFYRKPNGYVLHLWMLDNSIDSSKLCFYRDNDSMSPADYQLTPLLYDASDPYYPTEVDDAWLEGEAQRSLYFNIKRLATAFTPVIIAYEAAVTNTLSVANSVNPIQQFTVQLRHLINDGSVSHPIFYDTEAMFKRVFRDLTTSATSVADATLEQLSKLEINSSYNFPVATAAAKQQLLNSSSSSIVIAFNSTFVTFGTSGTGGDQDVWMVTVGNDNVVTLNDGPINQHSPVAEAMRAVKQLISQLQLDPINTRWTFRRYKEMGTTLSADSSLKTLYILQQALRTFLLKRVMSIDATVLMSTRAVMARYGILKKVDKLGAVPFERLLLMANIHPFPDIILDTYLDIELLLQQGRW